MVGPLLQNMIESVRELKEMRKTYERMVEKYDGYLSKPDRTKDPLIREETYLSETLEYISRLRQFRSSFELGLLEKVSVGLGGFGEFCWALGQMFKSLDGDFAVLREEMPKWEEEDGVRLAQLKQVPRRSNGITILEQLKTGKKSGYVYRKSSSRGLKGSWKRTYAQIDGHHFILSNVGRFRGTVQLIARTNVLLCEIRAVEMADRRNCFEIYTSQKGWTLCAENEEDMKEWVKAFESAKATSIQEGDKALLIDDVPEEVVDEEQEYDETPTTNNNNMSTTSIKSSLDYVYYRDNQLLHQTLSEVPVDELVLVSFSAIIRLSCEQYVTGSLLATINGLYLMPATLVTPLCKTCVQVLFSEIKSIEMVPIGEQLLSKLEANLFSVKVLPCGNETYSMSIMTIDPKHLDLVARLFRNSKLALKRSTSDFMSELSLSTKETSSLETRLQQQNVSVSSSIDEEVQCGCTNHLDQVEVNVILPLPVDTLFDLLVTSSSIIEQVFQQRKYTNAQFGEWTMTGSTLERDVQYVVPVNNPLVKAKETTCYERNKQTVVEPGQRYIIDTDAKTPSVPYGDTFITKSRICITKKTKDTSRLVCSVGMNWIKRPLVGSIIKEATFKGFSKYCAFLLEALKVEISRIKPDQQVMVIEEAKPIEQQAESTKSLSLLIDMFVEVFKFILDLMKQFPIVSLGTTFLLLLWLSVTLTRRIYFALFIHSQFILIDPTMETPALTVNWHDLHFEQKYNDLLNKDDHLRTTGEELVKAAKDLISMRANIAQAVHATHLGDLLVACYLERGEDQCRDLEKDWHDLIRRDLIKG